MNRIENPPLLFDRTKGTLQMSYTAYLRVHFLGFKILGTGS